MQTLYFTIGRGFGWLAWHTPLGACYEWPYRCYNHFMNKGYACGQA